MWLKRRIRDWLNRSEQDTIVAQPVARDTPEIEGLNFTVMRAVGGMVVQLRCYDRRKDHTDRSTYIVTDDEDLAERIGQIVAMESLKL
jgi:hypothetical protein